MDTNPIKVLLVEDSQADAALIRRILAEPGTPAFQVTQSERLAPALDQVRDATYDAILLDLSLPDSRGIATFRELQTSAPHLPVVVLTDLDDEEIALTAVQEGAQDFLRKGDIDGGVLTHTIRYSIERHRAQLKQTEYGSREKPGRVLGFLGAKGGVGTSTVALNVACVLAKQGTVVAAELKSLPGTFALQLHQQPTETICDLLEEPPDVIGRKEIEAQLTSAPGGLKVLYGPPTYSAGLDITPEQARCIIRALSGLAEYTVLDLPLYSSTALEEALHLCDLLTIVVEPEPVSVSAGKELLGALKAKGISTAITGAVVVNRAVLSAPLASAEISAQLGCEIVGSVPPVADGCALAVKLGAPLVLSQPESIASAALSAIAGRLAVDNVVALRV